MKFKTDFTYFDRKTKSRYVYNKYQAILTGGILDVGADECHLRELLPPGCKYTGVGLHSNKIDLELDLEKQPLPFPDNSFDVVLCLDVLEHLDNIHTVFGDLCRVSTKYVIISLPNPYKSLFDSLKQGDYAEGQHIKFYGLPFEKQLDRHKWFFSSIEAERFVKYMAKKNGMNILQLDFEGGTTSFINKIEFLLFKWYRSPSIQHGTLWAVLEKGA